MAPPQTITTMTTRNREGMEVSEVVLSQCPACGQTTSLHEESVAIGIEVLCVECAALLRVDSVNPLILKEMEEIDLF